MNTTQTLSFNLNENQVRDRCVPVKGIYFDVDGTLLAQQSGSDSPWALVHKLAGVSEETRALRQAQHRGGQITYEQWMALDISDWKAAGITREQMIQTFSGLKLNPGVKETLHELKNRGYELGIISSSLDVAISSLISPDLFSELSINRLTFDASGKIESWNTSACRLEEKGVRLAALANARGLQANQVAFVGNDFNDIGAARYAGVSFAFHCIDGQLARTVSWVDTSKDLRMLLQFFFGKT